MVQEGAAGHLRRVSANQLASSTAATTGSEVTSDDFAWADTLYNSAQFDSSANVLERYVRQPGVTEGQLRRAYELLAMARAKADRLEDSRAAFTVLLRRFSKYRPNETRVPAEAITQFWLAFETFENSKLLTLSLGTGFGKYAMRVFNDFLNAQSTESIPTSPEYSANVQLWVREKYAIELAIGRMRGTAHGSEVTYTASATPLTMSIVRRIWLHRPWESSLALGGGPQLSSTITIDSRIGGDHRTASQHVVGMIGAMELRLQREFKGRVIAYTSAALRLAPARNIAIDGQSFDLDFSGAAGAVGITVVLDR